MSLYNTEKVCFPIHYRLYRLGGDHVAVKHEEGSSQSSTVGLGRDHIVVGYRKGVVANIHSDREKTE